MEAGPRGEFALAHDGPSGSRRKTAVEVRGEEEPAVGPPAQAGRLAVEVDLDPAVAFTEA